MASRILSILEEEDEHYTSTYNAYIQLTSSIKILNRYIEDCTNTVNRSRAKVDYIHNVCTKNNGFTSRIIILTRFQDTAIVKIESWGREERIDTRILLYKYSTNDCNDSDGVHNRQRFSRGDRMWQILYYYEHILRIYTYFQNYMRNEFFENIKIKNTNRLSYIIVHR